MVQEQSQPIKQHPDYISPLADAAFVRLFATNERKYNTLHLLQAIFENDPEIHIDDITINDPRLPGETRKIRGCICDLHCSSKGKSYIIELQMYNEADVFIDRAVFNMSKQISTDHAAGAGHAPLKGTIFIGFTNFDLKDLEERDAVRIALGDMDRNGQFFLTDRFRLFFFQLNNFNKTFDDCITKLDFWLYSLKNLKIMNKDDELTKRIREKVQELEPFFDDAEYERMTPQEQDEYLVNCANLEYERQGKIACEMRGEARGIAKGKMEGKIEGKIEGKKEGKMEDAKAFKAKNIPLEIIAECTGLPLDEIQKL